MSFTGTLLAIETDGFRWDPHIQNFDRTKQLWKITVLRDHGVTGDRLMYARTGQGQKIERWRTMIGQRVAVLQGGKEGVVGGIVLVDEHGEQLPAEPKETDAGGAAGPQDPPPALDLMDDDFALQRAIEACSNLALRARVFQVQRDWVVVQSRLERLRSSLKARGDAARVPPSQERPQDVYPWGETMKQYAALGIGAEAWVELEEIERTGTRHRNNDKSGMSISWRTFKLVMTVLRAIRLEDFQAARVPPATPPQGWQPIETAPKDAAILGGGFGSRPEVCWWWDGNFQNPAGWNCSRHGIVYPTHWMPLPDPPATPPQEQP